MAYRVDGARSLGFQQLLLISGSGSRDGPDLTPAWWLEWGSQWNLRLLIIPGSAEYGTHQKRQLSKLLLPSAHPTAPGVYTWSPETGAQPLEGNRGSFSWEGKSTIAFGVLDLCTYRHKCRSNVTLASDAHGSQCWHLHSAFLYSVHVPLGRGLWHQALSWSQFLKEKPSLCQLTSLDFIYIYVYNGNCNIYIIYI